MHGGRVMCNTTALERRHLMIKIIDTLCVHTVRVDELCVLGENTSDFTETPFAHQEIEASHNIVDTEGRYHILDRHYWSAPRSIFPMLSSPGLNG